MRSTIVNLFRPKTPISTIEVREPPKVVLLNDRDPNRVIHHVHCACCKEKMLPSYTRVYYCMTCKVAYSEFVSYQGPFFINEVNQNGVSVVAASA